MKKGGTLFQKLADLLRDFFYAFAICVEDSNGPRLVVIVCLDAPQQDRARAVIQVVNIDKLRLGIFDVSDGEANGRGRLMSCHEADNRDGKSSRHSPWIGRFDLLL